MKILLTFLLAVVALASGVFASLRLGVLFPPIPPDPQSIVIHHEPKLTYTNLTLTSSAPLKELTEVVGEENVDTALKLNRIDKEFLSKGSTLVISSIFDWDRLSPFPKYVEVLKNVPKILLMSQNIQAFGVYEHGNLVRWGPISSGKESTPTANGLYFTNWKSEWIRSTDNYDWILKWNFNLDNIRGVGMHEYELPGYPASHSCVRMTHDDALWLYNWADQWIVAKDYMTILKHGTPVIIFGNYDFRSIAPWKKLVDDPKANIFSEETLESIITPNLYTIGK